jgi:hypothetical protein
MNRLLRALARPWCGCAVACPGRPAATNDGVRHHLTTVTGAAVAASFALLTMAVPAYADSDDSLRIDSGKLHNHGAEVQVRVSYHCEEGRSAGVGIFLTQATRHGPAVSGGAGSGQRPCTGETETVTLTIPAGSGHFRPGCAAASVTLFTSRPGTPDTTGQLTENTRLEHR